MPCKVLGNRKDNYDISASLCSLIEWLYVIHMLLRCYVQILTLQKLHIPGSFNMYLVINKCVTAVILSNFSHHYLRNRSASDIRMCFGLYRCTLTLGTFYRSLAHSLRGHPA